MQGSRIEVFCPEKQKQQKTENGVKPLDPHSELVPMLRSLLRPWADTAGETKFLPPLLMSILDRQEGEKASTMFTKLKNP